MSANAPLTDELRAKGQELAQRLQDDPSFRQEVESDPAAAMRAAGIPEGAAADFVRETGVTADVSGYQPREDWCFWTCFITGPR